MILGQNGLRGFWNGVIMGENVILARGEEEDEDVCLAMDNRVGGRLHGRGDSGGGRIGP